MIASFSLYNHIATTESASSMAQIPQGIQDNSLQEERNLALAPSKVKEASDPIPQRAKWAKLGLLWTYILQLNWQIDIVVFN